MTPSLHRDGEVFVLNLGDGPNVLSPSWVAAVCDSLDEVVRTKGHRALVTTASGNVWSNGLDLEFLETHPDQTNEVVRSFLVVLARTLVLPVPTIAAVQGHAFGGGGMLALCHDHRVMRADRGYLCLPEVDLHQAFTDGVVALVLAKSPPATAHRLLVDGARLGGAEALASGVVDRAVPEDEVLAAALETARLLATKHGPTMGRIKERLYGRVARTLRDEAREYELQTQV